MNSQFAISIADDFSEFPAGRVPADGKKNGEVFRRTILLPKLQAAMRAGRSLVVSLDGLRSCGSSFLESAFGGLVRLEGVDKRELKRTLEVVHTSRVFERYRIAISRYIDRAQPES